MSRDGGVRRGGGGFGRARSGQRDPRELSEIFLPEQDSGGGPLRQVRRRLLLALLVLVVTSLLVWLGRDGYHDNAHDHLGLLGAVYYATVTLSTTGYGDITPVSDSARITNILVITPLRVLFLIILVGTTLEVLTTRTRRLWRINRWRQLLDQHIVVVGYGTKGRNAVETLLHKGTPKSSIVIVDPQRRTVETATAEGLAGVVGDGTRSEVLRRAGVERAAQVIVAPQRDDTAVLVTLTVRQLNKGAVVVAAVREDENAPLLRQSGATVVVTSASSVGRLLGVSTLSPATGAVLDDLLTAGDGLDVVDRPVHRGEVGKAPRECDDLVVAVVRGRRRLNYADPEATPLQPQDRIIAIQRGVQEPSG